MKPLFVLVITFFLALLALYLAGAPFTFALPGRIALSVMLIFTAIGHFVYTKGMTMMVPAFIPFKKEVVFVTGFLEILAAAAIQVNALRQLTGWFLIVFFLVLLPANIKAARKNIDYQKGTYEGASTNYLWFRVPLQLLFICWTYYSCIR